MSTPNFCSAVQFSSLNNVMEYDWIEVYMDLCMCICFVMCMCIACILNFLFSLSVSGERCEFDRRGGQCVAGVCRNGGTCRELSGGGFSCECPAGGYEKPYCSVTTRSFPPKSFMMFRGLRQRFHLSISLSWVHTRTHLLSDLILRSCQGQNYGRDDHLGLDLGF